MRAAERMPLAEPARTQSFHIVAIDDDPTTLLVIEEFLSGDHYELTCFDDPERGLEYLLAGGAADVLLLDRLMPRLDGLAVMQRLRDDERLRRLPVIMETSASSPSEIADGIEAGVFFYLPKPFDQRALRTVVRHALDNSANVVALNAELEQANAALNRLSGCSFEFSTLEDVLHIASYVAALYPRPTDVLSGIREFMLNAVEHGNLEIGYAEKTLLNEAGTWELEIRRRLADPRYRDRRAVLRLERTPQELVLTVSDAGHGFDWRPFLVMDPARALDNHGRGIAIARLLCFDSVEYQAPGNTVVCRKRRDAAGT